MPHFLSEIRLDGIRGISDLQVTLDYPVSVVAGSNASGKSTVLFAAACAYRVPGAKPRDYVPSTLFPNYRPKQGELRDEITKVTLDYEYKTPQGRRSMRWQRKKGWNRSFFGRPGTKQPERPLYLRTLSNLSNPSEVRGILQMSRLQTEPEAKQLTATQINFAQSLLPQHQYQKVTDLTSSDKSMLFAKNNHKAVYSELHMAAGERSILRLSQQLAQLRGALVLIDEMETGLHPWVQELLMLQLQRLALRNDLQIIVTSHSPFILNSVPSRARILLDRNEDGNVIVLPPHLDKMQNALYGHSLTTMNWLCEDEEAEGILYGILDALCLTHGINHEYIKIGHNTGASEFPQHARAFHKFGRASAYVFILDGDQQKTDIKEKVEKVANSTPIPVLFMPGESAPEIWVWKLLQENPERYTESLNIPTHSLQTKIKQLNATYSDTTDSDSTRYKMHDLAEELKQTTPRLCRIVARKETTNENSDIIPLVNELTDILMEWRAG